MLAPLVLLACARPPAPAPGPPGGDEALAWHLAAVDLGLQGRTHEAVEAFRRAAAADPRARLPRLRLAEALLRAGREPEAVAPLEEALEAWPDDEEILTLLSYTCRQTGDDPRAIQVNLRRIALRPGDPAPYVEILEPLRRSRRHEEGFQLYTRAVDAHGLDGVFFLRAAGEMAVLTGRPRTALRYLALALELEPGSPETSALLRRAHELLEAREGAGPGP